MQKTESERICSKKEGRGRVMVRVKDFTEFWKHFASHKYDADLKNNNNSNEEQPAGKRDGRGNNIMTK